MRDRLRSENPVELARRSGSSYFPQKSGGGKLVIKLWGEHIDIFIPEFIAHDVNISDKLDLASQALLCYYLTTTDGTPLRDNWISFSNLPDGRFYTQAFQGYTGDELRKNFQDNLTHFEAAAINSGGMHYPLGNTAYIFELFPYVNLLVVVWLGDEDFPSNYQILFNANTYHHLPTDACAIAGSLLVRRITRSQP